MKFFGLSIIFFLGLSTALFAQMPNGLDTLYGNEWINYDQDYFQIKIAEDGVYQLPASVLTNAGLDLSSINAANIQVYHNGQEIPLYLSNNTTLDDGDYIEFVGQRNKGEIDRFLYDEGENTALNKNYSLFSDTSSYYLTLASTPGLRYNTSSNTLDDLPVAESWYWHEETTHYNQKAIIPTFGHIKTGLFEAGEGYGSNFALSRTINFPFSHSYDNNTASVEISFSATNSDLLHQLAIEVNGSTAYTENFDGFTYRRLDLGVNLPPDESNLPVTIIGTGNNNDRYSVGDATLRYKRQFEFEGEDWIRFSIDNTTNQQYLNIKSFNNSASPIYLDTKNHQRLVGIWEDGELHFKLPLANSPRAITVYNPSAINTISNLTPIAFIDYRSSSADFIIITNPDLRQNTAGEDWVANYAEYKNSIAGGNFNSQIIDINQLYHQFAYGINHHSISIRNFAHFIKKEWTSPEHLLLIGKSKIYTATRSHAQLTSPNNDDFYLPTMGAPGADILLVATPGTFIPVIPIGRIPAANPKEIEIYLEKLQAQNNTITATTPQTIEDIAWTKNIVHLGGGASISEQNNIKTSLSLLANTIKQSQWGTHITAFHKGSTTVIEQVNDRAELFERINNGVSIITFMGHSAPGTFDFNIDNPDNYTNAGKYPLIISLGCYSGNIHLNGKSIGERFCFYENKGALSFLASSGVGYIPALTTYANTFYQKIGNEFYGHSIGQAIQATNLAMNEAVNPTTRLNLAQFNLIGDPSIQFHPRPGVDLITDYSSMQLQPNPITAQTDSISLSFDLFNIGRYTPGNTDLIVGQQLPNGETIQLDTIAISIPYYSDHITIKVPNQGEKAVGKNFLHISVDNGNIIAELPAPAAENNNQLKANNGQLGYAFFVVDNSAIPIVPNQFGITSTDTVTLIASTSNSLAIDQKYIIQIDTTTLFNSPSLYQTSTHQIGGTITHTPAIPWQDNQVYYWRISPDSLNEEQSYIWETSSFSHLSSSSPGWRQGHYYQFLEDETTRLTILPNNQIKFTKGGFPFELKNVVQGIGDDSPKGYMNGTPWSDFFRFDIPASLTFVVTYPGASNDIYDNQYGHIWFNFNPGEYGSTNTTATRIASFPFSTETIEDRENIINFIENIVPNGAHVVAYTALKESNHDLHLEDWAMDSTVLSTNLFALLEAEGATLFRELKNTGARPYYFAFVKGEGKIKEQLAVDFEQIIRLEHFFPVDLDHGEMQSTTIGPSTAWQQLSWTLDDYNDNDTTSIQVWGLSDSGNLDSLYSTSTASGNYDLSSISTSSYPYLQLKHTIKDSEEYSPPSLTHWTVNYQERLELAVSPNLTYDFSKDTLLQGEELYIQYALSNLSTQHSGDSILIHYKILTPNNQIIEKQQKILALDAHLTTVVEQSFATLDWHQSGEYLLSIEVNPNDSPQEQHRFNNYINQSFFVKSDQLNPLLDVTFDGLHIFNGDIVAPDAQIDIQLKDESPFFLLADTSVVTIQIQHPDFQTKRIYFNDPNLTFEPATSSHNEALISYTPLFTQSGTYTLIVQGKDSQGNPAGSTPYKVDFAIDLDNKISNVFNYPNPFSTATQFVYTLTGSQPPTYFTITIMTVSGRVVRQITQDEIGPLKIGTHRTEYRWDGRDEYGDLLANGVYLYRIDVRDEQGEAYKKYDNQTDQFFEQGIGKMVILR